MRNSLRRTLLKRRVLIVLVLVTALLGGSIVYAEASKATTTYRTALVTYGTITQTIGMAGNLAPVSEANLNFASAGTVQSVDVQVGQTVAAGTTVAALDPTLLSAQLLQAQATLAAAQAKLAQDRTGPSLTSAQNSVAAAQVNVSNAQTSLTDTKAINAQTVAAAQSKVNSDPDCGPPMGPICLADTNALNAAIAKAQQSNDQAAAALATAQQQLASAESSLASLASSTPTSTLEIDQAQIEIDQVNVNTYQHELNGATLVSPIAGVVSQVNIAAGQSVTGGSGSGGATSYAIVIYTPGAYQMTGTVSDAQVNLVAPGQTVQVTPARHKPSWARSPRSPPPRRSPRGSRRLASRPSCPTRATRSAPASPPRRASSSTRSCTSSPSQPARCTPRAPATPSW
jgi:multidrug efflux pump subunit AcrA (membrane-fusion protein)